MARLVPSSPSRRPSRGAKPRISATAPLPPPKPLPIRAFGGAAAHSPPRRAFPGALSHITLQHSAPASIFFPQSGQWVMRTSPRTAAQILPRLRVPPPKQPTGTGSCSRFPAPGLLQAPSRPAAAERRGSGRRRRRGGGCSCDLIENTPAERRNPSGTRLSVPACERRPLSRVPARPGAPLPPGPGLAPGTALPSPYRPRPSGPCPSPPLPGRTPRT